MENLQVQAHFESTDGKHQCGTSLAASYLVWHSINYMLLIFQLLFIGWEKNKSSQSRILSGVLCVLSSVIERYPDRIIKPPIHNRYSLEITVWLVLFETETCSNQSIDLYRQNFLIGIGWLPASRDREWWSAHQILIGASPRILTLFPADVIALLALFHFKLHTGWWLCVISSPVTFLRNAIRRYNWKHLYVSVEKKQENKHRRSFSRVDMRLPPLGNSVGKNNLCLHRI